MITFKAWRHIFAICAAMVLPAGCAGSQTATNAATLAPAAVKRASTSVPPCAGQHTTRKYGELTARLKRTGGSLCIPAFAGFGGSMQYPRVDRSAKLTIRTSSENLYYEPELGDSGAPMVYINLHFHRGTHFGKKVQADGGLTSAAILPGDSYTAYGIVGVGHLVLRFPPCYSVATEGQYGGVFPNLGNLFSDTTITGAGYGVIEIYSGEQVSQAC
jgi:hypothetical protein